MGSGIGAGAESYTKQLQRSHGLGRSLFLHIVTYPQFILYTEAPTKLFLRAIRSNTLGHSGPMEPVFMANFGQVGPTNLIFLSNFVLKYGK